MKLKFNRYILQEEAGDGTQGGGGGDAGAGDNGNGGDNGDGANGGAGGTTELLAGKYTSQDDLVAGYTELQQAFSGKDAKHAEELAGYKSPEEYTVPEAWTEDGKHDARIVAVLKDIGKEHNLTQTGYEAIVDGITEMQTRVSETQLAETIASIPNFETRSENMQNVAEKFLRPDQSEAMDALMTTKESFEAVEVLMNQLRLGGGTLPSHVRGEPEVTEASIRAEIKALNPADTKNRSRLMGLLNEKSNGGGKLV